MDDELEPKKDPIDLKTEVGLSRREMLRRSAIVGGALVWSVPAIQSMGMKAAAAQAGPGPSPGQCGACYCFTLKNNGKVRKEFGFNGPLNTPGLADQSDCIAFCAHTGAYTHQRRCAGWAVRARGLLLGHRDLHGGHGPEEQVPRVAEPRLLLIPPLQRRAPGLLPPGRSSMSGRR